MNTHHITVHPSNQYRSYGNYTGYAALTADGTALEILLLQQLMEMLWQMRLGRKFIQLVLLDLN